jgi:hypothetical protein
VTGVPEIGVAVVGVAVVGALGRDGSGGWPPGVGRVSGA